MPLNEECGQDLACRSPSIPPQRGQEKKTCDHWCGLLRCVASASTLLPGPPDPPPPTSLPPAVHCFQVNRGGKRAKEASDRDADQDFFGFLTCR